MGVMKRKISESEKVEKVQMETKIEDVPDDSESRDQIRINLVIKSEQISEDFLYPKPIERWWSMENLARLSIWISFWATFYFFIDTIYVTGWRTTHPDLDQRSSIFPIIMASIYFSVISKRKKKYLDQKKKIWTKKKKKKIRQNRKIRQDKDKLKKHS